MDGSPTFRMGTIATCCVGLFFVFGTIPSLDAHPTDQSDVSFRRGKTVQLEREPGTGATPIHTNSLHVLTYNVKLIYCFPAFNSNCDTVTTRSEALPSDSTLPIPLGKEHDDPVMYRMNRIAERINTLNPEVVVLNEAIQDDPTGLLLEKLASNYPHRTARDAPFSPRFFMEGGIIILSKYPIVRSGSRVLNSGKGKTFNGYVADAARGVVHATIDKGGQRYDVFGVHIWPDVGKKCAEKKRRHWSIQKKELERLDRYVRDRERTQTPTFVAGDFNVGTGIGRCTEEDRSRFKTMLEMLDSKELSHRTYTIGERIIDHILLRHVDVSSASFTETLDYRVPRHAKRTNIGPDNRKLSDHQPVEAVIKRCNVPDIRALETETFPRKRAATGDFSYGPMLRTEFTRSVNCPGLKVQWEVATDPEFGSDSTVYRTSRVHSYRRIGTKIRQRIPPKVLKPGTTYYWRVKLGLGRETEWSPRPEGPDRMWAPPKHRRVVQTSPIRTFDASTSPSRMSSRPNTSPLAFFGWTSGVTGVRTPEATSSYRPR